MAPESREVELAVVRLVVTRKRDDGEAVRVGEIIAIDLLTLAPCGDLNPRQLADG